MDAITRIPDEIIPVFSNCAVHIVPVKQSGCIACNSENACVPNGSIPGTETGAIALLPAFTELRRFIKPFAILRSRDISQTITSHKHWAERSLPVQSVNGPGPAPPLSQVEKSVYLACLYGLLY